MHPTESPKKTAVIAAVQLPGVTEAAHQADILELTRLLKTLGYEVVGYVTQQRSSIGAASVFGAGKLRELAAYTGGSGVVPPPSVGVGKKSRPSDKLAEAAEETEPSDAPEEPEVDEDAEEATRDAALERSPVAFSGEMPQADVVVVDHEISPRQARNLEFATEAAVLDRTGVIVEIFHRHAKTREARLQVEIARLIYVVPRLRYGVKGSERQQGKGAGESDLELDKRRVRDRIAELKAELKAVARDEDNRRQRRQGVARAALVGYTNAGKSSLMRALTSSEVLVEDKLFATLGTTVRALHPEVTPRILVSDTVGFIKKLPHDLVASFRSTLDEALEAGLLLHVVDASDPDFPSQLQVTRDVLAEIGADAVPSQLVFNKVDAIDPMLRAELELAHPGAWFLSAHEPEDVAWLREQIIAFFEQGYPELVLSVPWTDGHHLGAIRALVRVLEESWDEHGTNLRVRGPQASVDKALSLLGG